MTHRILCSLALAVLACSPENGDPCPAYCAKLDGCGDPRAADCPETCAAEVVSHEYPGEACGARHGDYVECRTAASCSALADEGGLCEDQLQALESDACTIELCDQYAARLVECGLAEKDWKLGRAYECTEYLKEARFEFSDACGDATEKIVACATRTPCEQINSGDSCKAEETAADEVCM